MDIREEFKKMNPLQKAKTQAFLTIGIAMRSNVHKDTQRDLIYNALSFMSMSYRLHFARNTARIIAELVPEELTDENMREAIGNLGMLGVHMFEEAEKSSKEGEKIANVIANLLDLVGKPNSPDGEVTVGKEPAN